MDSKENGVGAEPQNEKNENDDAEKNIHFQEVCDRKCKSLRVIAVNLFNGTRAEMQEENASHKIFFTLALEDSKNFQRSVCETSSRARDHISARDFVERIGACLAHDGAQFAAENF